MNFLDDEFLKDTQEEIEKRESEFAGDQREKMSAGSYKLWLCKVETESDAQNVPMVKVICNVDEDQKTFRDLSKTFRFNENEPDKLSLNKKMFVEFFYKAFKHKFKPADLKGAIAQIKKYEGKKFSATVQIKQRLMKKFEKDDEGKPTSEVYGYLVVDVPQIYFVGTADQELTLKPEKKFIKMKEKEIEEYEDHKMEHPARYDENGRLIFQDAEAVSQSADNISFDRSPESSNEPVQSGPNDFSADEKDDDLPW